MRRLAFGIFGLMITIGFGWWRFSMTADLDTGMAIGGFDAAGVPGDRGDAPPGDLATLSTPAGALNYLNYVAETLQEMDAQHGQAMAEQIEITGSLGIGPQDAPRTSSAGGGRVLSIESDAPGAAAGQDDCGLDGAGCGETGAPAPAPVTVFRPRR